MEEEDEEEDEEEEVVEEEEHEEHEEDVEIIEETEVVEGDTEGVDIEDVEEYVEVFDDDGDDSEEMEETGRSESVGDRNESVSPRVTDEKEYDEFAWGHHPVMMEKTRMLDETADEAPMDELEFLRKQSAGETPFDEEEKPELHPVFQVLDEAGDDEEVPIVDYKTKVSFSEPKRAPLEQAVTTQSTPMVTRDIEAGVATSRDTGAEESTYDRDDGDTKRRWQLIIACLLVVAACAITALILPFVLDYDNERDISNVTPAPTVSPAPTATPSSSPTFLPTLSPAPSQSPTLLPSTAPTLSQSPTQVPSRNPTGSPTVPPTPGPTRAPVVATSAPTRAPVVVTPTNTPIAPTRAPTTQTSKPVAPSTLAPTTLRLGNLIEVFLIPLSGEDVFKNQSSPQFKAAQFIADVDEYATELTDETRLAERYALTVFYYATGGENWNQCSLGDTTCPGPWLTGDVCAWEFVTCNDISRVTSLNFGTCQHRNYANIHLSLPHCPLTLDLYGIDRRYSICWFDWLYSSGNFHLGSVASVGYSE